VFGAAHVETGDRIAVVRRGDRKALQPPVDPARNFAHRAAVGGETALHFVSQAPCLRQVAARCAAGREAEPCCNPAEHGKRGSLARLSSHARQMLRFARERDQTVD